LVVAARFDVTFGAVSQHLRVLEDAGLVSVRRDGRRRLYQARREQLGPLRAMLEAEPEPAGGWRCWSAACPTGGGSGAPRSPATATGTNVAGADLDRRFRWVTGFWDPPPDCPEAPQRP
jgi:regulatory ArsR family protein